MQWHESGKKKAVTFSYDDGTVQDARLIDLFQKYGIKGTFNLCSEWLPRHKGDPFVGRNPKVCREDVRALYAGQEIAAHTLNHLHLTKCEDGEVIRQVEEDRRILSDLAGYEVVGLAYPYTDCDGRVMELIKNHTGIRYCRAGSKKPPDFEVPTNLLRVNATVFHLKFEEMMTLAQEFIALEADSPKLFYVYGHSYELDDTPGGWEKLEELLRLISNREDIFYGTNREVLLEHP